MSDANPSNIPSLHSNLALIEVPAIESEEIAESVSTCTAETHSFEALFSSTSETLETESFSTNPEDDLLGESFTKHTDWLTLAREVRQQNRDLLKTIVQLEQALADSQQQLQSQEARSLRANTLIAQQAEELNKTQAQLADLLHKRETSQQNAQSQQLTIENLAVQLEASQQQVAQLERQFALLQAEYNERTHKLLVSEKQVRQLHSRLQRQQRYTLQYKAALEQYETPAIKEIAQQPLESSVVAASLIPEVTSIQPWSSQTHSPVRQTKVTEETLSESSPKVIVEEEQQATLEIVSANADTIAAETVPLATQLITDETLKTSTNKSPSHVISPVIRRQSKPNLVDLPSFLRDRS